MVTQFIRFSGQLIPFKSCWCLKQKWSLSFVNCTSFRGIWKVFIEIKQKEKKIHVKRASPLVGMKIITNGIVSKIESASHSLSLSLSCVFVSLNNFRISVSIVITNPLDLLLLSSWTMGIPMRFVKSNR